MNPNVAAAAILAGAILILSAVLFLNYRQHQRVRLQVEKERREREEKELRRKLRAQQNEKGDILFNSLSEAGRANKVVNVHPDGQISPNIGPIEVWRIKENGNLGYSIIIGIPDPTLFNTSQHVCLQVDINMEKVGKEVLVFKAPYGPGRSYSINEFGHIQRELCKYVAEFRLFPVKPADLSVFQET